MPGSPVLHYLPECAQIHVHWVSDTIQPSHPLPHPSPLALHLPQHQSFPVSRLFTSVQFSSVAQSYLTVCEPMDCSTPGLPVPSSAPRVYSNSCPLSQWCHPAISSSVIPFSSCPQSFPASGSFQMSQLFASRGQIQKPKYLGHCSCTAVKRKV